MVANPNVIVVTLLASLSPIGVTVVTMRSWLSPPLSSLSPCWHRCHPSVSLLSPPISYLSSCWQHCHLHVIIVIHWCHHCHLEVVVVNPNVIIVTHWWHRCHPEVVVANPNVIVVTLLALVSPIGVTVVTLRSWWSTPMSPCHCCHLTGIIVTH